MRIAVISDLHLGVRDRADRFGHTPERFARFLDRLEADHDRIIVGGDLYETWQGARFGRTREALAAIRRAYPRLTARLEAPPYLRIIGNHDPSLALEGVPRELELSADGVTALFTHGHRWDPPLKAATPIAYTFSWGTGWLARGDDPFRTRVFRWRHRFERRFLYNVTPSTSGAPTCPYQRGATALLASRPDLDLVVCGHTHVPAHCRTPHGDYLNSGAIAGGSLVWVQIDTRTRSWRVVTWDPSHITSEAP